MGIKRQIGIITIFLGLLLMMETCFAAGPEMLTGVTTGRQKIIDQDIPRAKQKAVDQALETAVQNAFATLISRQVFAANLEFLYEKLLPMTSDYVTTYRVLGGMKYKGNYLVGVESKINLELLEKHLTDARILNAGTDKPVILFLIAEQMPGDILPRYWWGNNPEPYASISETIILEQMSQNRFQFIGIGPDRPVPSFYNINFSSIYDANAAMELGRALKADMVVLGKANAAESINRMGDEKIFDAVIELKGYDLGSGKEVVLSLSKGSAKTDMNQEGAAGAITKAADLAARDLILKIDAFWTQNLRRESLFDVAIEGDKFLSRFIALKKRFKEIRDIENIQPKEIGSSSAVMEIVFKGNPEQFAHALMLKTFDGFGIEIADVTDQMIKIHFIEKRDNMLQADDIGAGEGKKIKE
ncbi:MAG: hypothetical protein B6230_06325 [Desulfobacteraceae bacterium 4572_89]|nr:MAG: hypothetical protein B6230_06325 [Desulfobacteraceae bacterium 4572_89]